MPQGVAHVKGGELPRVDISGRNKGIRYIDLGRVIPCREDVQLLRRITHFDLSHNELEVLSDLNPLAGLRVLDVSYNRITQVVTLPLSLTQLHLSHNKLTHLEGLSDLIHLRHLDVSFNRLVHFAGLHPKIPLEVLIAEDNHVQRTLGLDGMSSLKKLALANNFIESAEELHFLSSCPSLEALDLSRNPVTQQKVYRPLVAKLQPHVVTLDGTALRKEPRSLTPATLVAMGSTVSRKETLEAEALERRRRAVAAATPQDPIQSANPSRDAAHPSISVASTASTIPAVDSMQDAGNQTFSGLWSPRTRGRATPPTSVRGATATQVSVASEESLEEEEPPTSDKHPPQPIRLNTAEIPEETGGYAKEFRVVLSRPTPRSVPAALRSNEARLATNSVTAQLHDAIVAKEQVERENQLLHGKLKQIGDQLRDSRRVVAEQLATLSQLRQERDAVKKSEEERRELADRLKRNLKAAEVHHKDEVRLLQQQFERMKVFFEAQVLDLRSQLSHERSRHHVMGMTSSSDGVERSSGHSKMNGTIGLGLDTPRGVRDLTATSIEEREQMVAQHSDPEECEGCRPPLSNSCSSLRTGDTMSSNFPVRFTEKELHRPMESHKSSSSAPHPATCHGVVGLPRHTNLDIARRVAVALSKGAKDSAAS